VTVGIPPPSRNHRTPTGPDTPASLAASTVVIPSATANQNITRSSRRPAVGRPGDRIAGRPVTADAQPFGLPIATLLHRVLRRPRESAQFTAVLFGRRCERAGIEISIGSVGDCYDKELVSYCTSWG
jgi:hypothetical protein